MLPDADLDLAAASILKGGFSFSGQRCTAVKIVVAFEAGPGRYCSPRHPTRFKILVLNPRFLTSYDVVSNICQALL